MGGVTGKKWGAHGDFVGRTAHEHSAAGVEIFVPIRQNETSLVFIDGNINGDFEEEVYGSFGLGFRHILNPELILGGIVALDYTRSENGRSYGAVTLGAEAIGRFAEARVNVQLPFSGSEQIGDTLDVESDEGTLSLMGNRLVERFSSERSRVDEVPLTGVEGEVGINLPLGFEAFDDDLRAFAGAYHYSGDGVEDFTGISGRLEYRVRGVLGELSPGSELILSAGATHDEEYGTNFAGEVRLRVPLGVPSNARSGANGLSEIERRMTQRVVRNSRIHTAERSTVTEVLGTREAVVVDPRTGRPYDSIFFADGADTAGAGTIADPTTLGDAVTRAGAGGVVVAEGNNGTIDTLGVALADRQRLLGGGTAIPVRLADGTVTTFVLGQATPTIQGAPTANVITLGRDNMLASLNILGGMSGVGGTNVGSLTVENLSIGGSGGTGFSIQNTAGDNRISIAGLDVSGAGGAGIAIDGLGGGSTTITGFSGVSVPSAAAGGVLFDGVVFDADPDSAGFQRVQAGSLAIGDPANPADVTGDGLRLNQVLGDLAVGELTTGNNNGAGLFTFGDGEFDGFILDGVNGTATNAARGIDDNGTGATDTVVNDMVVRNFTTRGIEITPSTNSTITNVTFADNASDILVNASNTTISDVSSTGATGAGGVGAAIRIVNATGTTTLTNLSIVGGAGGGLAFDNAGGTVTATNVDISGTSALRIGTGGNADFTFDNTSSINNTVGTAVIIQNRAGGSFTFNGAVASNGTGAGGVSVSGAMGGGNGIGGGNGVAGAGNAWTPDLTLTVTSNEISGTDGSGISLVGLGTSGIARFKVANNSVGAPVNVGGFASYGIEVLAGNISSADDDVFLNIFGNTSAGSNGGTGIGIRKQGMTAETNEFGIFDAPGGPDLPSIPTNADVIAFINALNAAGGGTTIRSGSNYTEDTTEAPQ